MKLTKDTLIEGVIVDKGTEVSIIQEGNQKLFYTMNGVGNARYTVNFYDGVQTHKDGSPFYAIKIFKNKIAFQDFVDELLKTGYKEK